MKNLTRMVAQGEETTILINLENNIFTECRISSQRNIGNNSYLDNNNTFVKETLDEIYKMADFPMLWIKGSNHASSVLIPIKIISGVTKHSSGSTVSIIYTFYGPHNTVTPKEEIEKQIYEQLEMYDKI